MTGVETIKTTPPGRLNKATQIITMVLGITLALAGMHHGFFETLQGNAPTGSLAIQSIGPKQVMWVHGTDDAVTIIPNFLITGIAAIVLSLLIVLGSLFLVRSRVLGIRRSWFRFRARSWPTLFLLLFVLLTLVGGGIGHIIFFLTVWAYATRIDKPLSRWKKLLSGRFGKSISASWAYSLAFASFCFVVGLEISVFGLVPGMSDPDRILAVCWGFLLLGLIFIHVSYVSGFAYDIGNAKTDFLEGASA